MKNNTYRALRTFSGTRAGRRGARPGGGSERRVTGRVKSVTLLGQNVLGARERKIIMRSRGAVGGEAVARAAANVLEGIRPGGGGGDGKKPANSRLTPRRRRTENGEQ